MGINKNPINTHLTKLRNIWEGLAHIKCTKHNKVNATNTFGVGGSNVKIPNIFLTLYRDMF
jgi:hypothetical protein